MPSPLKDAPRLPPMGTPNANPVSKRLRYDSPEPAPRLLPLPPADWYERLRRVPLVYPLMAVALGGRNALRPPPECKGSLEPRVPSAAVQEVLPEAVPSGTFPSGKVLRCIDTGEIFCMTPPFAKGQTSTISYGVAADNNLWVIKEFKPNIKRTLIDKEVATIEQMGGRLKLYKTMRVGAIDYLVMSPMVTDLFALMEFGINFNWSPQMTELMVMHVMQQMGEALVPFHAKGRWHGDLKQENIGIDAEGQFVPIDLGSTEGIQDKKREGWNTAGILSPEALAGKRGRPMDMWAMGILLAELLRQDRTPFHVADNADPKTLFPYIREGHALFALWWDAQPEFREQGVIAVCSDAWDADKKARFQSIVDFFGPLIANPCGPGYYVVRYLLHPVTAKRATADAMVEVARDMLSRQPDALNFTHGLVDILHTCCWWDDLPTFAQIHDELSERRAWLLEQRNAAQVPAS